MSDLIKRSDAIEALCNAVDAKVNGGEWLYTDEFCKAINNVLSADRPQGKWIYTNNPLRLNDEWECSRCGNVSFVKTNYCDRCGARMKGADDETD